MSEKDYFEVVHFIMDKVDGAMVLFLLPTKKKKKKKKKNKWLMGSVGHNKNKIKNKLKKKKKLK